MITSQWITFYFAIVLGCGPRVLEAVYESLPVKTHVFEIGKRLAKLASKAGLTKTISYVAIKYARKYNFRQRGRIILQYYLKLAISHVEGYSDPGGGVYTTFTINKEGLVFNLNVFEDQCSIFEYNSITHPRNSYVQLRISDWWSRLVDKFNIIDAQHYCLLAMTPQEIRSLTQ
jgi:hypothetical protein